MRKCGVCTLSKVDLTTNGLIFEIVGLWNEALLETHEVLNEIDETLDQLIKNATALHEVSNDPLYQVEVEALKKTQESLLAHLIHLDRFLKDKSKDKTGRSIYDKLTIFSELSSSLAKQMRTHYSPPSKKRKQSKVST